jgi:hypothetical protein
MLFLMDNILSTFSVKSDLFFNKKAAFLKSKKSKNLDVSKGYLSKCGIIILIISSNFDTVNL